MGESDWTSEGFRSRADAWIEAHAPGRVVAIEQVHVRPWSTAIRVETTDGVVWFKAGSRAHRHEASATAILSRVAPDALPELLAVDADEGWMLARDAGVRLRELTAEERSLRRWHEALRVYSRVQRAAVPLVDELLAAGVPDRRLARLPELFARVLARLPDGARYRPQLPRIESDVERLAGFEIPETIQHDDLHDAQVFVREGRTLVTDWGDAVIAHPFLSMAVTLEGVIAWGLDDVEDSEDVGPYARTYLAAWGDGLEEALRLALPLGWAARCVGVYDPDDPEALAESPDARLGMLVRGLERTG